MVYSRPNLENDYFPFRDRKKGSKTPLTQEQWDFVYELITQGYSANSIGKACNISSTNISRRIRENDWAAKKKTGDFTQEKIDEMAKDAKKLTNEELSEKYQLSVESIIRLKDRGWQRTKKRKNKYSFNEDFFNRIDNELAAYWLGFLYADGYILSKRRNDSQSFGFNVSVKDVELLENFKADIKAENPINIYENSQNSFSEGKYGRLLLTSQYTVDKLKEWGMTEHKTFSLTMPHIPLEQVRHFIRGYFDGDGSISRYEKEDKYNLGFCGTKELLTSFQEFFGTSVQLSQRWPERNNNNYTLHYCGNPQIYRLLSILYKDATRYLSRKYNRFLELENTVKAGV